MENNRDEQKDSDSDGDDGRSEQTEKHAHKLHAGRQCAESTLAARPHRCVYWQGELPADKCE